MVGGLTALNLQLNCVSNVCDLEANWIIITMDPRAQWCLLKITMNLKSYDIIADKFRPSYDFKIQIANCDSWVLSVCKYFNCPH